MVSIEDILPRSLLIFDFLGGSAYPALQVGAGQRLASAIDTLAAKSGRLISPLTHGGVDIGLGSIDARRLGGLRRSRAGRRPGASGHEREGQRANRNSK
jgi:hypothetical protein